MVGNERSLVREDREASLQAGHGVNAVRVVEEAIIGEDVSLRLVPLGEHAPVGLDKCVDVGEGNNVKEAHFWINQCLVIGCR